MTKSSGPWSSDYPAHLYEVLIEFRREAARAILRYELNAANAARKISPPKEG